MKLSNLIWVLALAGAAMACNSGPPISGCEEKDQISPSGMCCEYGFDADDGECCTHHGIDEDSGECVDPLDVGSGGGGGGSGGSGPACDPGTAEFTNACTCSSAGEVDINCDYGCVALANTFGFAAILDVIPDAGFVGGGESNVGFEGFFSLSEAFIEGAGEAVGATLSAAVVVAGATIPVTALSGATGPDVVVTLPGGFELDLTLDPNNNGVAGPIPLPFEPVSGTFTFAASGDACFNLSTGISFTLDITNPPLFPVPFSCQPANQEDINAEEPFITAEATAGQVCFAIP